MPENLPDLRYRVAGRPGSEWLHARGSDLSVHGVFVHSSQIFPPGTRMLVALTPAYGAPLLLPAKVSWARTAGASGMGVVFENLNRAETERLLSLIRPRRSPRTRAAR